MKRILAVLIAFIVLPSAAMADDICESINEVANGWNDVANLVVETGEDGLDEEESAAVVDAVGALTEATAALVTILEGGDEEHVALAESLNVHFVILTELTETDDEAVAAIDGLVSTLDQVTDLCDVETDDEDDEE